MSRWAASELQLAELGDTRRNKPLVGLVEDLSPLEQLWRGACFGLPNLARYHSKTPANTVLATHQWQARYCTIHKTPQPLYHPLA